MSKQEDVFTQEGYKQDQLLLLQERRRKKKPCSNEWEKTHTNTPSDVMFCSSSFLQVLWRVCLFVCFVVCLLKCYSAFQSLHLCRPLL